MVAASSSLIGPPLSEFFLQTFTIGPFRQIATPSIFDLDLSRVRSDPVFRSGLVAVY
ncbi:hypothetical protein CDL15_Pgr027458 [Punica granatum]|uniref:Uncharacterized protein n=1 Tax=Punica granatum TaxID=22663 RepID=A0A218XJL7_PUNGR|nr:hypothetical protein CDL15_Pgr027458 [Punica granatum]